MEMMTPTVAGATVSADGRRGGDVLPDPIVRGRRGLSAECGEFARMAGTMKEDEAANPADVGLFGTQAVVVDAQDFDHAVIQPGSGLF